MLRKLIAKLLLWACKDEVVHLIESESREYNKQLTARVTLMGQQIHVLQLDSRSLDSRLTALEEKLYVLERDTFAFDTSLRKGARQHINTKKNRKA